MTVGRYSFAANWHESLVNLEAMTDFVAAGYWGTLAQWKEFLGSPALLPTALKHVTVKFEFGHQFSFVSKRVSFSIDPSLLEIGSKRLLGLGFTYLGSDGKFAWDISDIRADLRAR